MTRSQTVTAIDPSAKSMDEIVALCKRRGFVYPASEIYGGINGFWDYGPLGTALKNNIRDHWWKHMVECPPIGPNNEPIQMVGLDSAIIQNPKTWEASGHVAGFADPMRKCTKCGHFVRADQLWELLLTSSKWFRDLSQKFTPIGAIGPFPQMPGENPNNQAEDAVRDALADVFKISVDAFWRLVPITGGIDTPRLMNWAKTKGKKLAPNLALVRNPEVTLSWLAQRVNGQPDAPPDMMELTRYLATEQLHATGLQEPCPRCGGELGESEPFNLMFESYAGITQTEENKVYLRPETAQGIFLNYKNVLDTMRVKVPFGIAQVGKAFRNEITPRNFFFRSREFEQMEMEWFCPPEDAPQWFDFWKQQRMDWWLSLGTSPDNLILRDHEKDELSHYSQMTVDIEYKWPFTAPGFGELEGVAHRGCFDLTQHQEHSGQKMEYFDQAANKKYIPNVIEPAAGLTRATLLMLCEAFTPTPDRSGTKFMLSFKAGFAPIKAGIFPLVNKDGMPEKAVALYMGLREKFACQYDAKQSIGKRYARMDEAGTPFCFTIDGETLSDNTVTVRDRDSQAQERINIDRVESYLTEKLSE